MCLLSDSLNVGLVALVCYIPVIGVVDGDVIVCFRFVVFLELVVQWWWWWSSGGCDSCCKGGNSNTCNIATLKCVLGGCVGGDSDGGGLVVQVREKR